MELSQKTLLLIRDILISVGIVGIILAALWGYTGQFPQSPMVVVTSGSMMHDGEPYPEASYGKIGTIDPGDLVLVKKINDRTDVIPRGALGNPDTKHRTYREYGDVIIYYPMGNKERVPIIHRAICWVEVNGDGTYTVEAYGIERAESITIEELHLNGYKPQNSGFITKGDNNEYPDQIPSGGICEQPVKVDWIVGKARGEIPWFGLIKLMIFGNGMGYDGPDAVKVGNAVAPKDEWVCLGLSMLLLIGLPTGWDAYNYYKKWKSEKLRL
ncbi:MAG: S26 family signal peptidase [Thermoplasmata archaeon]|nr:MAG: S26 family signal peptidase [Thermoplasmata archaeon]RLF33606.1 MAG: S26 family signal peptidase [Thermoplasmata archaeon]